MPMSARSGSNYRDGNSNRAPIQDRLVAEVEKRRENREKMKRNLDMEEMRECSFQPKLNAYALVPRGGMQ